MLVVEHNPNVLEATAYMLEAAFGCKTLGALSCAEALALIDGGGRFDLLLSEVVFPGKDGLTLARLARERIPNVPVVSPPDGPMKLNRSWTGAMCRS